MSARRSLIALILLFVAAPAAHGAEIRPSPDGDFITAWLVYGPTSRARGKQLLEGGEPGGRGWAAVVGDGIYVDAGRKRRPRRGAQTWFGIVLVAEQPVAAELKLGTDGIAEVFLDGKPLSRHERRHNALWDDHVVDLKLEAGRHTLLIQTTRKKRQRGRRWQIVARIQDARGAVPSGLRLELPGLEDLPRRAAEAATLRLRRQLRPDGFEAEVALAITGSVPAEAKVPWTMRLVGQAEPLATGHLGDPPRKVRVTLKGDDTYRVVVEAGGRTWNERWVFRRRWHEGLLAARRDLEAASADKVPQATLDSIEFNLDKLTRHVREGIRHRTWLGEQIVRVRSWAKAARAGKDPFVTQRGDFYRAYRSRYDGNLQHYSVHVPRRYDRRKRWPLVIGMHGIGSGTHYTLRRVLGKDRDKEGGERGGKRMIRNAMPRLPNYGVITATAWGYHNSAFWFYGEDDVMRVIEEMKAAYRIDPDRVYLTGLSLGGLGTYHIGHHFPDVFAALGPLGGFSSVKLYRQIRQHHKQPWEEVLIEQRDATTYAENGLHTPMKVVHGRKDMPRHAKAMTNRYKKLGYRYELDIPDLGHDVWQYSYGKGALIRWMKRFRRPKNPDRVVFKTHTYRYVRAYWTRVGWIDDYTRPALLKVQVDKKSRRRITVEEASNLRGFTLDLSRPKLAKGPVTIRIAGQELKVAERGPVHLRREGDGPWKLATSAEPPAGYKRPGTSGPCDDVMYEPHYFVVGTQDPAQTDVNRRLVSEDRGYLRHRNHDIWFPVLDDVEVTDAHMAERSLVLYGNPKSNKVLQRILATGKVPLSFEDGAIVFGGKRYAGEDVGIKLIVPNPLAPSKSVVIVAGVTWKGTLLSRFLPRFIPDFIIYDRRIDDRYMERILIDRPVRAAGFFKSDWSL